MLTYIVGCQGVVQLGGSDPWYNWAGPAEVVARKSFQFTESSLVVKIIKLYQNFKAKCIQFINAIKMLWECFLNGKHAIKLKHRKIRQISHQGFSDFSMLQFCCMFLHNS